MPTVKERAKKSARTDVRMPPETKEIIRAAAERKGVAFSAFVTSAAYEAAQKTILEHEAVMIELDREQSLRVAESLQNPPEPNEALRNLARSRTSTKK